MTTDTEPLDFSDLAPRYEPVRGPDGRNYILMEATADAAVRYRNAAARAGKWADGKVVGFENIADAEPLLVALCLAETNDRGEMRLKHDNTPITVAEGLIRKWPHRVLKRLFDRVKVLSPDLFPELTREELVKERERIDREIAEWDAKEETKKAVADAPKESLGNGPGSSS